jgi:predicted dienelactone hydrolase
MPPHTPFRDFLARWRLSPVVVALFAFAATSLAQPIPAQVERAASPPVATAVRTSREVLVYDLEWTDAARGRDVPARLYWPANLAANERAPLVVFSHGLGGSRMGYSHLGRYWAAQGFATLHLQHVGSDRAVWAGGFLSVLGNLQDAANEANAIARAQDVTFGITTLLADARFAGHIDDAHIAIAGHSFGANTALLVAGAAVSREIDGVQREVSYRDPRIRAAILMSAPPFYGAGDMHAILRGVAIPTLHLTGTDDVIRVPGYYSDAADRIALFEAMPAGAAAPAKTLAIFNGGTHSIFTDRVDMAGAELNRVVKAATREVSLEFLNAALRGAPYARVTEWLRLHHDLLADQVAGPVSRSYPR